MSGLQPIGSVAAFSALEARNILAFGRYWHLSVSVWPWPERPGIGSAHSEVIMNSSNFKSADELVNANIVRHPNESADYRRARQALFAEEIELRRHIERVAEMRRALPPGGEATRPYEFEA
jgi:hypothetical protein